MQRPAPPTQTATGRPPPCAGIWPPARLTIEEFDSAWDQAYTAKTLSELEVLMADLPQADLVQLPNSPPPGSAASPPLARPSPPASIQGRFSPAWRAAWGSWLAVSLRVFAIWLISGASGGPWFLWVALPLGAILLGRWITGAPARSERRSARPRRNHWNSTTRPGSNGTGNPMNW